MHHSVQFLDMFAKSRKATLSFVMSVRLSVCPSTWNNSAPTGRIFMKFYYRVFFDKLSRKSKFNENRIGITVTLQVDQYTFLVVSHSVFLRLRNVSDEHCRGNQRTHFVIRIFFFFFENRAVYEIMWKNIVQRGTAHMAIRLMRIASWITKATHSHYVIIVAFPQQQWLHKRAQILRLLVHCLSCLMLKLLIHQGNRRFVKVKSIFVPKIDHLFPFC
jgi:hypothetical protein